MFDLPTFEKALKKAFTQVERDQSETISIEISANFIAGQTAAEKHNSIDLSKSINFYQSDNNEDEGLTDEEKAEITALVALYAGYISEFNDRAQAQILSGVKEITEAGGDQVEVKQYIDDVFSGEETIVIDNVGKKRKEIYVDRDLNLSEVTRTVTKPFYSSVNSYVALMGAIVAHTAYEAGKKSYYKGQGYNKWVFTGPADEVARPWHICLLGQVFEYGTAQSNNAEWCLQEPRCRHRAEVYYGDERDTPKEYWEKQKKEAGLYWDKEKREWSLK